MQQDDEHPDRHTPPTPSEPTRAETGASAPRARHTPAPADPIHVDLTAREPASRDAMSAEVAHRPRLPFTVVGIGASAGGLEALTEFFEAMPSASGMAFVIVQHLSPKRESLVAEILQKHTPLTVRQADDGMAVEPEHVYVIRPGFTLTVRDGRLHLGESLLRPGHSRPVDDFFRSLAEEQRERAVCIVMSGMGSNGTAGAQEVRVVGGVTISQEPDSAKFPAMPRSLIHANLADFILRPAEMPEVLLRYAQNPYAVGGAPAEQLARSHIEHVHEILAILRTRTRQDFGGYKKATLVRRIQRRMGLTQQAEIRDYARLLRQTPAEVRNLADDLLIHVTGFFRDPEVWDAIRDRVVRPLVTERNDQGSIRVWVTACASGEEAYSLAMLLVEAAEAADKQFDIKVFATDMAERTLQQARAGLFPGGIESEVSPDRLARFFDKDAGMYRVKKAVRELVVFAPQNVLQDPPFSRLDIITCRNLMIYLEPDLQQRLLTLLHFGLREHGALVLGNSETIGDHDELFEPLDKRHRIYRRIGPPRPLIAGFPLPRVPVARHASPAVEFGDAAESTEGRPVLSRQSLQQVAHRYLLERHTPPSVVVDRAGRIVYFHGETELFLDQPRGEPTREVLALARPFVRGPVRVALHRAVETNESVTSRDGTIDTEDGPHRLQITVAPLERAGIGGHFLISFEHFPVTVVAVSPGDSGTAAGAVAGGVEVSSELHAVRTELQSAIEELQTANEELKASNEEVTSINEELQSSNEELETSKEEMQSLNEELTTVNAQLQAKIEEHEGTSNDLMSLLASTDIAVIFLDRQFRIRRYTPAVQRLMDLIPTDLGRPLADMARRFDDPRLAADAQQVLDSLIPLEAEVRNDAGDWFARRVLPYRTTDNRIDGVVLTFMDISERKRASRQATEAREYAENVVETLHEPLLVMNPDLTVKSANRAFYNDFNVRPDQTVGRKIYELGNGQWDLPGLRRLMDEVLPDNNRFDDYEVDHEFEGIGRRVMLLNGRRLDHLQLILLGVRDVTDAKRAEEWLRESEEQFRAIVQGVEDHAIFAQSLDGRISTWNPAAERVLGFAADEAIGQPAAIIFTPEDRVAGAPDQESRTAREKGRAVDERWHVRKDGSRLWGSGSLTLLKDDTGRPRGFVKILRDDTERKLAEEALQASEARFAAFFDQAAVGLSEIGPDGRFLQVNDALCTLMGRTREALLSIGVADLTHPDDVAESAAALSRVLGTGERASLDKRYIRPDRTVVYAHSTITRIHDGDERSRRVLAVTVDLTERRRAERASVESDARFRGVTEVVPEMLWQADPSGRALWHNQRWIEYTGQSLAEAQDAGWLDVVHPDDRQGTREAMEHGVRTGEPWRREHRIRRGSDGAYRWFAVEGRPQRDETGTITSWFGSITDIHERRTVLDELAASERQLKSVLEGARDFAILLQDPQGRITQWNAGATALLGWTDDEAIGQPAAIIFTPEDRAAGAPEHEMRVALRDGRCPDERWHMRKDGSRFWGSGVQSAIRDESGALLGLVKILRDTTHWKETELALQASKEVAEAASRAKDDFLATLSHELRTPLSAILIWTRLLATQAVSPEQLTEGLDVIERSAEAQRTLIDDLLDSARITSGQFGLEMAPTELANVVSEAVDAILPSATAKGIDVQTELASDVGVVMADAGRLRQIVWNLLSNAVKFSEAGDRIDVGLSRVDGKLRIRVADTGRGIDPAFLPHLFERFRRGESGPARTSSGLGLGLAIVKQLVELHNGTIDAASPGPGEGAVFTIDLPLPPVPGGRGTRGGSALGRSRVGAKPAARPPRSRLAGVRVLLVEDEPGTRTAARKLLESAGAEVSEAKTGAEALEAFGASPPQVLVCDIGLPDVDGYELLGRLRALDATAGRPPTPALALTAYAGEADAARAVEAGFDTRLTKPADATVLLDTIARLVR